MRKLNYIKAWNEFEKTEKMNSSKQRKHSFYLKENLKKFKLQALYLFQFGRSLNTHFIVQ